MIFPYNNSLSHPASPAAAVIAAAAAATTEIKDLIAKYNSRERSSRRKRITKGRKKKRSEVIQMKPGLGEEDSVEKAERSGTLKKTH